MIYLLLLLFSLPLLGQPTVTGCAVNSVDHTSAQVYCTVSASDQHSYLEYGTSAGVYTARTKSRQNKNAEGVAATYLRMALGGLTPNTTYYVRASARPNSGNLTNIGYSSEFSFTTSAAPATNPPFPTAPTEYSPTEPNTAGYTVVLMKRCSSGYPCADGAVAGLGISNEASLQTVINSATYGTVIRFPRGLDVNVEHGTGDGNKGYELHAKAVQAGKSGIDDPTHDWIVLEGEGCSSTAHFPPFGARIDTTYQGKLPVLRSTLQQAPNRGSHFQVDNTAAHHYWLRCLELATPAGGATNLVNPPAYRHTIFLSQNSTPIANQKYFVLDRLLSVGVGGTKRQYGGWYLGPAYTAVIGSHLETGIWRPYTYPTTNPTVGGTGTRTLTIPSSTTYRLRASDPLGGNASGASATVTSAGASGRFVYALTSDGSGKFYYDTRSVSSVSCTNCTAVGAASDPSVSLPTTEYTFVIGTVSAAGALSIDYTVNNRYDQIPSCSTVGNSCEMSFGLEFGYYNPGPVTMRNNYVSTTGLAIYLDGGYGGSTYDTADVVIRGNWVNIPKSRHWNNGSSDGYRYSNRQPIELKRGRRWLVQGNLITGNFSYQNAGPAVFLSGRGTYTSDTGNGIADVIVRSNTVAYGPMGFECSGNIYASADPVPPRRILFENNLMRDLNRFSFDNGGPGALNNAMLALFPACQQVRFRNNTVAPIRGLAPLTMFGGGDDIIGAVLEMRDNVIYYGQGDSGCARHGLQFDESTNNSTYPRTPALTGSTTTARIASFFNGSTITNNLMIGGKCYPDSTTQTDLSSATVTTVSGDFSSGQTWPAGNTMALRESAAGISSTTFALSDSSSYRRASADKFSPLGADQGILEAEQGIVSNISVTAQATAITARYTAPDSRACSLDASSDSGATWSRATDAGGGRHRTVSVTGLSASTAYTWRLHCYAAQTNDGRQWDDWASDRITTGSVTTGAAGTSTRLFTRTLSGGQKLRVTLRLVDGTSPAPTTCNSSPCSVSTSTDAVSYKFEILSALDAVLIVGDWQKVN